MKLLLRLLPAAAACLFLCSCVVTSVHPLSSPEAAQIDPELVGTWGEKGDAPTYDFTVKNAHWMHYVEREGGKPKDSSDFFVTKLDGCTYMNYWSPKEDHPGYELVRYEIIKGRGVLTSWGIDPDKAAAAVRAGRLAGTVYTKKNAAGHSPHPDVDVLLRASGEEIAKFIHDEGVGALFTDKCSKMYRIR